ncbi:MAG TPA: hypothetical protein VHU17_11100 [Acidimicrobiales bacterium]|jgi:hypothetical protein|nr:hypothetical protein [Acidimicrobiales bacterium]
MAKAVNESGGDSSITYAEIHSELEEVRRILVDLTGTVERLSSIVSSVRPQPGDTAPAPSIPAPGPGSAAPTAWPPSTAAAPGAAAPVIAPSPPSVAPNPVDAILGDSFGRPT